MQSRLLRVLIVEDNPDDALLMIRQLKREGFDLRETVVDTCEQLSSHLASAEFDVVLSDYNLGASNGQDCLSKVRELKPDLPFILVSGKIGEEAAVELMKQGAQDFVLKDQLARLGSVIQRELDERVRRNEADLAKKHSVSRRADIASCLKTCTIRFLSAIRINEKLLTAMPQL